MTPEDRAMNVCEILAARLPQSVIGPSVAAIIADAIRAAVAEERELYLLCSGYPTGTDQRMARFHYNAQFPGTWEYDALEAVRQAEREACASLCDDIQREGDQRASDSADPAEGSDGAAKAANAIRAKAGTRF